MIRRLSAAAVLVICTTLTAPNANAQFTGACGGVEFFSCVNLAVSGQGTSQLMFTVTNVSNIANNTGSELKEIGIGSVGYTSTAPTMTTTGSLASRFTAGSANPNTFNGAGFDASKLFELTAKAPSPTNGLHDGESVSFFLTFTHASYASDFLDDMQLAIQDQQGADGCSGSNKVVFNADGKPTSASASPECGSPPPTTTTPEPGSMALLGTGILGLVPVMRRRRK